MRRHRRVNLALAAFCLIVLSAVLFGAWHLRARSEGVVSEPLQPGTIIESVYGIGTVLANRSYQLKPGVTSTIDTFYVKEGDTVKKGAPLAKLDRVVHRAPFSGTVTYLPFKEGENVFAQVPVLTLVDLRDRYLVVSLEQQGALRTHPGQRVIMSFDTNRRQSYSGVVESIYSSGGNFLARIDVSSLPSVVLPGMTADVAIEIRKQDNALIVPVAALMNGNTLSIKRGMGIPKDVEVKVGIVDKAQAEIVSGDVQAGDRVLIKSRETS